VRIEIDDGARSRALAPPMRQDGGMLFEKQCLHGSLPQDAGDNAATITRYGRRLNYYEIEAL